MDAVASMLYLDYGKEAGQWVPNEYGENKNLEAIEFFRHLNTLVCGRNPGAVMIAEESTAWPMVTGKAEDGGLNFTYKWNMGWMHDFLDYMKLDPYFRKDNHNKMTFAMSYNYSEKYILVLSHDEVVHLKCSMLNKMPGLGIDKYRNLMVGYSFMMGHPGKKLLFMGQDFGQLREWSEKRELDWDLLEDEKHSHLQSFVKRTADDLQKNIRQCMSWMIIRKDLSGSIQMTDIEAFSVLCVTANPEETAYCLYATLHRWHVRIIVWAYRKEKIHLITEQ